MQSRLEMIEKQKKADESSLANILAAIIIGLYMTNVVSGIGWHFGLTPSMVSLAGKILIFFALLRCLLIFVDRLNTAIFFSTFGFALVTAIQQVFFPNNAQYMRGMGAFTNSTFFTFFVTVLPAMYTISAIWDFDVLLRRLQSTAVGLSLFTAGVLLIYGGGAFAQYSMGFASSMILPTCLVVTKASEGQTERWKTLLYAGLSAVDVFSIAMYGSRGAFVAVTSFMLYFFLWERIKEGKIAAIAWSSGLLMLAGNYQSLLRRVNDWALNHGFDSRTLRLLSSEKFGDSGRSKIYGLAFRDLATEPFKIRGINYDYNRFGTYCHNWFLELLYAFGIFFGGICCAAIAFMLIKSLWKGARSSKETVQICLTFAFFPVCFVSGSIWVNTWFWCWVILFFADTM